MDLRKSELRGIHFICKFKNRHQDFYVNKSSRYVAGILKNIYTSSGVLFNLYKINTSLPLLAV